MRTAGQIIGLGAGGWIDLIAKITYSKGNLEQRMTLVKINSCKRFIVSLIKFSKQVDNSFAKTTNG